MSRAKGSTLTSEHRQNISKALKGKPLSDKNLAAIREANKNPELRALRSKLAKARWANPKFSKEVREKINHSARTSEHRALMSNIVKNRTKETRELLRLNSLARWSDPVQRAMYIASMRKHWAIPENRQKLCGKERSEETREKIRQNTLAHWQNPEIASRRLKSISESRHTPNNIEILLQLILDKHYPNTWKFVGDGQLIIGGKCPDFTNINGKKELIELFGDYWHKEENPQIKISHYQKYGFKCIVIWEHELRDKEKLLSKLRGYCK